MLEGSTENILVCCTLQRQGLIGTHLGVEALPDHKTWPVHRQERDGNQILGVDSRQLAGVCAGQWQVAVLQGVLSLHLYQTLRLPG